MHTLPTGRRGQTLALAMALLAIFSVWAGVIAPIWHWYDDRVEELRRQQSIERRMASLVNTLPSLEHEAALLSGTEGADGGDAGAPTGLLPGATDALAAAWLQQRIDELAGKAGVRVGSEEILPGQTEGDLRSIAVRLTVTGSYRSVVDLLAALAGSDVPIVVDELVMRGLPASPQAGEPPMDISMTVISHRSAKRDAR